jgi:hypothetical protein
MQQMPINVHYKSWKMPPVNGSSANKSCPSRPRRDSLAMQREGSGGGGEDIQRLKTWNSLAR